MPDYMKLGTRDLLAATAKITQSGVALGTQAASQGGFTYYPIAGVCLRGILWRLTITPSVVGAYNIDLRSAAAGGGTQYLAATGASGPYDISVPVYLEGDSSGAIYLGIQNISTSSITFTLTTLGVEKLA